MNYNRKYYEVIVGNIGKVHEGHSKAQALKVYNDYVKQSKSGYGRAAGEGVDLYDNGEDIIKSYPGTFNENPAPKMPKITQDDLNAAARGLRMLTMSESELTDLIANNKGNQDLTFAGKVIAKAAQQMLMTKRRAGLFGYKSNPDIHVDINSHNQREAEGYMKNPAYIKKKIPRRKAIREKIYIYVVATESNDPNLSNWKDVATFPNTKEGEYNAKLFARAFKRKNKSMGVAVTRGTPN